MNRWVFVNSDWEGTVAWVGVVGTENCACGGGSGAIVTYVYVCMVQV